MRASGEEEGGGKWGGSVLQNSAKLDRPRNHELENSAEVRRLPGIRSGSFAAAPLNEAAARLKWSGGTTLASPALFCKRGGKGRQARAIPLRSAARILQRWLEIIRCHLKEIRGIESDAVRYISCNESTTM